MAARKAFLPVLLRSVARPSFAARLPVRSVAPAGVRRAHASQPVARQARFGVRAYSAPAGQSRIWSFEEVQKATQEAKPSVVIIDTREPGELRSTGRIPGAVNIPITSAADSFHISADEFEDRFGYARPSRDSEVVFYCKAGVRSRAAAGLARDAGWTNVGEFPGSWLEWSEKGGEVQR